MTNDWKNEAGVMLYKKQNPLIIADHRDLFIFCKYLYFNCCSNIRTGYFDFATCFAWEKTLTTTHMALHIPRKIYYHNNNRSIVEGHI